MAELRVKSTGTLKLFESDNTSSVTIASPASLGGDRTVTLPDADVTLVSGTMSTGLTAADITGQTALGAEPADTDEFVLSDAGVLKRVDYSYLKAANTPAFEAYLPSTQNIGDGVTTKITASTERFDTDGEYDHTTNYRFTPQTAGKYFVYLGVEAYSTGGGDTTVLSVQPIIQKNGATCLFAYDWQPSYGCRMFSSRIFGIIDMNGSSDYVEPFCSVWVSTGDGTLRGSATRNTLFGAFKVIT